MKIKSANGLHGCLIIGSSDLNDDIYFRVYDEKVKSKFYDYKMNHSDLQVQILDSDAFIYNDEYIDYSPETLGVEYD